MSHLTELGSAALAPCAYSVPTKILNQTMRVYKKEQTVKNIPYLYEFQKCFHHSSSNACKLLTCQLTYTYSINFLSGSLALVIVGLVKSSSHHTVQDRNVEEFPITPWHKTPKHATDPALYLPALKAMQRYHFSSLSSQIRQWTS